MWCRRLREESPLPYSLCSRSAFWLTAPPLLPTCSSHSKTAEWQAGSRVAFDDQLKKREGLEVKIRWSKEINLISSDLSKVDLDGVYVIGYAQRQRRYTVYVGQGDIKARLAYHRRMLHILSYGRRGTLKARYAKVSKSRRDGVELYLANELEPLEGYAFPRTRPIRVNKPPRYC